MDSDQTWNGFEVDYLVHIALFFPWMGLAWITRRNKRTANEKVFFWIWLVAGLLIAAGAEFLQYFLSYRAFNPVDLGLNVFGVLLGAVVFNVWKG